jgi:hypothetical protein
MTVAEPWQSILVRLLGRLAERGFEARTTFDLQLARSSLRNNEVVACPQHGSGRCTCQYIVLQISRPGTRPSAVVVHGYDTSTKVALLSPVAEKVDAGVAAGLYEALEHARAQGPKTFHLKAAGEPARGRTGKT